MLYTYIYIKLIIIIIIINDNNNKNKSVRFISIWGDLKLLIFQIMHQLYTTSTKVPKETLYIQLIIIIINLISIQFIRFFSSII